MEGLGYAETVECRGHGTPNHVLSCSPLDSWHAAGIKPRRLEHGLVAAAKHAMKARRSGACMANVQMRSSATNVCLFEHVSYLAGFHVFGWLTKRTRTCVGWLFGLLYGWFFSEHVAQLAPIPRVAPIQAQG